MWEGRELWSLSKVKPWYGEVASCFIALHIVSKLKRRPEKEDNRNHAAIWEEMRRDPCRDYLAAVCRNPQQEKIETGATHEGQ